MLALPLLLLVMTAGDAPTPDASAREAIERSITALQEDGVQWVRDRKCASCHHAPMALWTLAEARARGFAVDTAALDELIAFTLRDPVVAKILPAPTNPPAPTPGTDGPSFAIDFAGIAARSVPPDQQPSPEAQARMIENLVRNQEADGSWLNKPFNWPPMLESPEVLTTWTVLGLMGLAPERTAGSPVADALEKASRWLDAAPESTSRQVAALRLLRQVRSGGPPEARRRAIERLLSFPNADGGWGQDQDLSSDAYATGQALYALGEAGVDPHRPEIARARAFLLATQREDGSWPMASRPRTPGGNPAKDLTPITFAGSAWATLGLMGTMPARPVDSGAPATP